MKLTIDWRLTGLNRKGEWRSVPTREQDIITHQVCFEFQGDATLALALALTWGQTQFRNFLKNWKCFISGSVVSDDDRTRLVFLSQHHVEVRDILNSRDPGEIFTVGLSLQSDKSLRIIPEEDATG